MSLALSWTVALMLGGLTNEPLVTWM